MENNFAYNLKQLRIQNNMTQEELGKLLNKDYSTIGKWENGTRSPIMEDVIKISQIFNISLEKLIGDKFIYNNLSEVKKESLNDLSILDNVLYSKKDKIDSVKNLPIEKQQAIANAVKSVLDMIDDNNSNQ